MAGLAPLGASPAATTQLTGTGASVPGSVAPNPAPPPPSPAPAAKNFTAFPPSYDGFGADGAAYGTPGVINGQLSIVAAPPPTPPLPADPGAGAEAAAVKGASAAPATAGAGDPAVQTSAADQAQAQSQTQTGNGSSAPGAPNATTTQSPPTPQKTDATDQKVAKENGTLDNAGNTPVPAGKPAPPAPPAPTGLLGGGPPPIPGGTAVENNPALGLLGAPATNPIVIQADKQESQAAEAAAQAAHAQAAVAQLEPAQQKLTAEIQGQTFAGVGSTPPPSFARPEIPTVFLNIAS